MSESEKVSNVQTFDRMVSSIREQTAKTSRLVEQTTSEQRLLSPADDPVSYSQSMHYQAKIAHNKEFEKTYKAANTWITATSNYLDQVIGGVYLRAGEIATDANDGSKNSHDRQNMADEVDALLNSLLQLTNGQLAGNYLFSGSKTETPPFRAERNADQQIIAVYYEGDSFVQKYRMSNDGMSQINLIGGNSGNDKAFGCFIDTNSGVNVFSTLIKLRDRINDNIMDNSAGDMITEIQSVTDHLITAQTRLGGFQKIAQLDFERVEEQGSYMEKALKDLVDMDPIQSLIEMNNLQVLYQASLAMATRISQTTLLNYM